MNNVDELRRVEEGRQVKAVGLDGASNHGNAGALELLVVGVPGLGQTSLGLNLVVGLPGLELVELALILLLKLLVGP